VTLFKHVIIAQENIGHEVDVLQMYILPAAAVSKMELRIPPELMRPIAAPVQEPGWACFTFCNIVPAVRVPP
jgi:hypothetical protein